MTNKLLGHGKALSLCSSSSLTWDMELERPQGEEMEGVLAIPSQRRDADHKTAGDHAMDTSPHVPSCLDSGIFMLQVLSTVLLGLTKGF